jgi:hypothetical protein
MPSAASLRQSTAASTLGWGPEPYVGLQVEPCSGARNTVRAAIFRAGRCNSRNIPPPIPLSPVTAWWSQCPAPGNEAGVPAHPGFPGGAVLSPFRERIAWGILPCWPPGRAIGGNVTFASGGILQLDSLMAFGGTISGFTLGDEDRPARARLHQLWTPTDRQDRAGNPLSTSPPWCGWRTKWGR